MFETIGVLIVFFILLGIGISVYFAIQKSSYQKETQERKSTEALTTAQKMFYLPELDCNFLGTTQNACIEEYKAKKLKELLTTDSAAQTEYYKVFGYSTIKIKTLYPTTTPFAQPLTLYKNEPKASTTITTQTPIIVYSPLTKKYSFGYAEVKKHYI